MLPAEIDSLDRILHWRATTREEGRKRAASLIALPAETRAEAVANDPENRTVGVFDALLAAAHEELDRNPVIALELTTLIHEHLDGIEVPLGAETYLTLLRALAWKEHAHALRETGSHHEALSAVLRSVAEVGGDPLFALERADAELLEGYLRHHFGENEAALRCIAGSTTIYLQHGDIHRYLSARTMEGIIHYELRQYRAAELAFLAVKSEAEEIGDRKTVARVSNNYAHALLKLDRIEEARQQFTKALVLFEELMWDAERQRAIWGLASILAKQGRVHEAIDGLVAVRTDFLGRGMVLDAAAVSLDIVETLITAQRTELVPAICTELVRLFAEAGMPRNALRAFAYLEEQAARGDLDMNKVRRVHGFVQAFKMDSERTFAA